MGSGGKVELSEPSLIGPHKSAKGSAIDSLDETF